MLSCLLRRRRIQVLLYCFPSSAYDLLSAVFCEKKILVTNWDSTENFRERQNLFKNFLARFQRVFDKIQRQQQTGPAINPSLVQLVQYIHGQSSIINQDGLNSNAKNTANRRCQHSRGQQQTSSGRDAKALRQHADFASNRPNQINSVLLPTYTTTKVKKLFTDYSVSAHTSSCCCY